MARKASPRRGMYEMVIVRQAASPPPIRGLVPGYGQQIEQRRQRSQRRNNPLGDREGIPPRTRYSYPKGPTRPNPGTATRRRRTYN